MITDAARYQLGARAVDRFTGEVRHLTDHPPTAIQNLLALDSAMSEHLVAPDDVRALDADARGQFERALAEEVAGKNRTTYREPSRRRSTPIDRRAELLGLVEAYRRLKRDLGLMDFSDQIELGARLAGEQPDVGVLERVAVQGGAARRVPGHLGRPGARCCPGSSAERPRGHRGRRPQPGDLRLARRVGLQHPQLRRHLPAADGPGADATR